MALFGLVSKREYDKLAKDLEALKANFMPYENWQLETARAERWALPDPSTYEGQMELFRRLSSVFLAVDVVSTVSALTDFSVARVLAEKENKDIPNHPFELLLQHPNPHDGRFDFLYATVAYWRLNRNSYWWLNRRDEFSPPDEMWVIPPHMIIPVPDENMYLRGYLYYPGTGAEIFLEPHEICHFKGFNPFSRFVGLSAALESLFTLASGYLGMVNWQTKLYGQNNARLPGILSFEQMIADPTWNKIKSDTREAANDRSILMLRGVGQGLKWQQSSANQREMEFTETLDAIDKKIMDTLAPGAYTMLYENANEANSRTGKSTLIDFSVYPMHVMMAQRITNNILPAYPGRPLVGNFEDIRITDKQMELQERVEYAKTHTINQINEKYYQSDEMFDDDRGKLIPVQLNAQSGDIQKPEPPKQFGNPNVIAPQQELQSELNEPPQEPEEKDKDTDANKAMLEALGKYERYALRKMGQALKFENDIIPDVLIHEIALELSACKSEPAVKAVFKKRKAQYYGAHPTDAAGYAWDTIRAALTQL